MAGSSFPILTIDQAIVNCKQLYEINISEDELRNPTFQFAKRFYQEVLTTTLRVSTEQLTQPHFNLLGEFQHPELAEDAAPTIFFSLLVQRFMHACAVKDFSKADILDPKPNRALKCISAVVNFAMFKSSQDYLFEDAIMKKGAIIEQKKQLLTTNQELQRKIEQIKAARSQDEEHIQQIIPEIDNFEQAVHDLNKQQAAETQEISQRKTEIAEMTSKEAEIKVTIASDKEECEKLKAQIVTSPDKFREEINRLNNAMHSCKSSTAEKSDKLLEYENQADTINRFEENATQAVKLITSVEEEIEKLRILQNKGKDIDDIGTNDDELLRELTAKLQNVKRHLASTNEKHTRLKTKNDKKVSATSFSIKQAEKDQDIRQKSVSDGQNEAMAMDAIHQEILKASEGKEISHTNAMESKKTFYQYLLKQFHQVSKPCILLTVVKVPDVYRLNLYHGVLEKGWIQLAEHL